MSLRSRPGSNETPSFSPHNDPSAHILPSSRRLCESLRFHRTPSKTPSTSSPTHFSNPPTSRGSHPMLLSFSPLHLTLLSHKSLARSGPQKYSAITSVGKGRGSDEDTFWRLNSSRAMRREIWDQVDEPVCEAFKGGGKKRYFFGQQTCLNVLRRSSRQTRSSSL